MTRYADFASFSRRLTAGICMTAFISSYGAPALAQAADQKPAAPAPQAPEAQPPDEPGSKAPGAEAKPGQSESPAGTDAPSAGSETKSEPPERPEPDEATRAAAAEALAEADEAFESEDYEAAHAKYVESNALAPSPAAKYGAGLSLVKLDRPTEAYVVLTELMGSPDRTELGDEKLAEAQRQINELGKVPGTVELTTVPATATVSVDGTAQPGESPRQLELLPGKHTLAIEAPGFEKKTIEVDVKPAEQTERSVELEATPEPEPAAPPPAPAQPAEPAAEPAATEAEPEERSHIPAYVTLGVAGATAIVGTIFGIKALSAKSDFDDNPTTANADDVERNALIADMALGVTITLGVTGVVLLTSDEPSEAAAKAPRKLDRARIQISPYVSPKGDAGGASARVTF